jgi:hypothetical protein
MEKPFEKKKKMRKLITIVHSEIRVIRITVEICVNSTERIDLDEAIKKIKDRKITLRKSAGQLNSCGFDRCRIGCDAKQFVCNAAEILYDSKRHGNRNCTDK